MLQKNNSAIRTLDRKNKQYGLKENACLICWNIICREWEKPRLCP